MFSDETYRVYWSLDEFLESAKNENITYSMLNALLFCLLRQVELADKSFSIKISENALDLWQNKT